MSITCTIGPTCSGKSFWAEEMARRSKGKCVNLNRDDFRFTLTGSKTWSDYKFSSSTENAVTALIREAAADAIRRGKNVIVSDTNMNPATLESWRQFASDHNVPFHTKHFKPDSLTQLLERNRYKGPRALPEHIVKDQYDRYMKMFGHVKTYEPDETLPKCVIFDLDGTLFDNTGRHPFDWSRVIEDTPRASVVELFKMYEAAGYDCVTVSGRDGCCREESLRSLEMAGMIPAAHFQRAEGDSRPDDIVKEEIFWREIAPKWHVLRAIDDRTKVVDMWRLIGVECWQVAPGNF